MATNRVRKLGQTNRLLAHNFRCVVGGVRNRLLRWCSSMPQVCRKISTGFLVVAGSGFGNSDGRVGQPKNFWRTLNSWGYLLGMVLLFLPVGCGWKVWTEPSTYHSDTL